MKARTILLFSAAFFCVFHYARAIPWNEVRFDLDSQLNETAAATSLHRYTRDLASTLTSIAERVASGTIQIPENILQTIVNFIRGLISKFEASLASALESAKSVADSLSSGLDGTANFLVDRKRRAILDIMETVPDMILHPVSFLERSVDTAQSYINGQIGSMMEQAMNVIWSYVSTVLLPWVHSATQQLEKSGNLPSALRTVLHEFDSTYSILQSLGYADPKSRR